MTTHLNALRLLRCSSHACRAVPSPVRVCNLACPVASGEACMAMSSANMLRSTVHPSAAPLRLYAVTGPSTVADYKIVYMACQRWITRYNNCLVTACLYVMWKRKCAY